MDRRDEFENIAQWCEVGKVQIREFCQNFTVYSSRVVKHKIEQLERQIKQVESHFGSNDGTTNDLRKKKMELWSFLQERE